MRKINCFFDNLLWYVLYSLPLLITLFYFGKTGDFSLSSSLSALHLDIVSSNDVYVALDSIFGVNGLVPCFVDSDILMYFTYFILVFLMHLAVDFLLFIPRFAHFWLNKLYGGDSK